jgi:hypothetical protein
MKQFNSFFTEKNPIFKESVTNTTPQNNTTNKAIFLVGSYGSGKDYILNVILSEQNLIEISLDNIYDYFIKETTKSNIPTILSNHYGIIINGPSDNVEKIYTLKEQLNNIGYNTSMVLVNTTNEVSKQRNINRGLKGGRIISENVRKLKWDAAQIAKNKLTEIFNNSYFEYNNSIDINNNTLLESIQHNNNLNILKEYVNKIINNKTTDLNKLFESKFYKK